MKKREHGIQHETTYLNVGCSLAILGMKWFSHAEPSHTGTTDIYSLQGKTVVIKHELWFNLTYSFQWDSSTGKYPVTYFCAPTRHNSQICILLSSVYFPLAGTDPLKSPKKHLGSVLTGLIFCFHSPSYKYGY